MRYKEDFSFNEHITAPINIHTPLFERISVEVTANSICFFDQLLHVVPHEIHRS